ncbi:MAG: cytochrome c oxidase subunit 4, partial [Acidimicrobiia bacterium]|nr:cytochrome c oxidase subunit 4 [Acidimicrobiia bacterium]
SKVKAKNLPPVGPDPWDARGLEWMTASPTPEHNFDEEITVHQLDEFWHRKYDIEDDGTVRRVAAVEDVAQDGSATDVHLPSPSYWPIVVAAGLPIIGYGLIYNLWLCVLGGLILGTGVYGWVFEPADDPDAHHGHDDHGDDDHGDDDEHGPDDESPTNDAVEAGPETEEAPVG